MQFGLAGEAARVTREGDQLVVQAGFEHFFALRRIAGGAYNSERRVWIYPGSRASDLDRLQIPFDWSPEAAGLRGAGAEPRLPPGQARAAVTVVEPPRVEIAPAILIAPAPLAAPSIAGLLTSPWRHQILAYQFADRLLAGSGGGCLLAIIMGGGKTLTSIMLMQGTGCRLTLIVCPLRVVPVWPKEIQRHLSAPMVMAVLNQHAGTIKERVALAAQKLAEARARKLPLVAIINYEAFFKPEFLAWASTLTWDLVIADESHRIKQPGGKQSLAFKHLRPRVRRRLGLSGTPLPHSPLDIYGQYRFLDPRIFGTSYAAFRQYYAIHGGYQNKEVIGYQHEDEFRERMGRICFRVGTEVLDLPPARHLDYVCEMSKEASQVYAQLDHDLIASIEAGTVTAANAMVKLLRLQQITGGSIKTDSGEHHRIDSSKADLLQDVLEDLEHDEPVVIFCRFHADLDVVHEVAGRLGRRILELSGRRDELAEWQAGEGVLLAVQISAGGVGVDLTRAAYSIHYSLSFSLMEFDQSLARLHRPGQLRGVLHMHLMAAKSVDFRIRRALRKRADVVNSILAEMQNGIPFETAEDAA